MTAVGAGHHEHMDVVRTVVAHAGACPADRLLVRIPVERRELLDEAGTAREIELHALVIQQMLPHSGDVGDHRDAEGCELGRRADARPQQDRGRVICAGGDDHPAGVDVRHSRGV